LPLGKPIWKYTQKTIQELGVNLKIIANKGSVMLLPEGINKASGLKALCELINLSPDKIVGVGDGENDCDFFTTMWLFRSRC
jgi:Predicted hydrolases of the HAD superfamily